MKARARGRKWVDHYSSAQRGGTTILGERRSSTAKYAPGGAVQPCFEKKEEEDGEEIKKSRGRRGEQMTWDWGGRCSKICMLFIQGGE